MEKIYKAVIIDDEESAIDNLCFELKRYDYISVEGVAHNGTSGMKLLERIQPDLLFQDVELPDMLGMDLVTRARRFLLPTMNVVFYTAYDKYMIDALRNYAFDFLLKPVDPKELHVVLSRFCEKMQTEYFSPLLNLAEGEKPFMVVTPTGDLRFLRASEIGYFRYLSDRKIWEAVLINGTFLPLRRNSTADQLCEYDTSFVQVHQAYIINIKYLIMVQDNHCIMYPPFNQWDELMVSKKYKKAMMDYFFQL